MGTYDYTLGGGEGFFHQLHNCVWAPLDVSVPDIIASDDTLTTNATIASSDVIEIYDIPAGSTLTGRGVLETITPGTTGLTVNIGIAGSTEMFSAVSGAATAGTMLISTVASSWGSTTVMGVTFAATDTLDFTFGAAETVGRWVVWVELANLSKVGQVNGY